MFNVGPEKLMVVLLVALIVLGPDKLPNAARQIGRYLNDFRRISQGFQQELRTRDRHGGRSGHDADPTDARRRRIGEPAGHPGRTRARPRPGAEVAATDPGSTPAPDAVDAVTADTDTTADATRRDRLAPTPTPNPSPPPSRP